MFNNAYTPIVAVDQLMNGQADKQEVWMGARRRWVVGHSTKLTAPATGQDRPVS